MAIFKKKIIKTISSKKGFTILELIIVIIIVGVLASLALPRFFKLIERSRVTEALVNIGVIRQAMERCGYMHTCSFGPEYTNYRGCVLDFPPGVQNNTLNIDDPNNSPGAHFTYSAGPEGSGSGDPLCNDTLRIEAFRNTLDGGDNGISGIYYEVASGPPGVGHIFWEGYGVYFGMHSY